MSHQFNNIVYLADVSGTGQWRRIWPMTHINCVSQGMNMSNTYSQIIIGDPNYYKTMTSITVQRWISDAQCNTLCNFFKPIMDSNFGWLIYEIDDNMSDECIPKFNRGRKAYEGEQTQCYIRTMLNTADFVTVTTDYIKHFYHEHYGVPLENIIAIPNLLPRYLFGDRYDPVKKVDQFSKNKRKPRVGIVSSLSHFNVDNVREDKDGLACRYEKQNDGSMAWVNENGEIRSEDETKKITDDFDDIADTIRETVNDFQWVCYGYCPPQVKDLVDAGKIEFHGGTTITTYPSILEQLQLQAIIAPIKKMEFNYCKSFIKTMECAAIGVPLFATNCLPYDRVMNRSQLFDDGNELKEKLLKLKFMSTGAYKNMIEQQWKWLNSPCEEGDFKLKNFWMEDNSNIWIDMFRLRQKALPVNMSNFEEAYRKRKEDEAKNVISKSESGEAVITM